MDTQFFSYLHVYMGKVLRTFKKKHLDKGKKRYNFMKHVQKGWLIFIILRSMCKNAELFIIQKI